MSSLREGLACTLLAGLLWGLVFIAPVLLPDYPALYLSAARYFAFGCIALGLSYFDRTRLKTLTRSDWLAALELSLIGNLFYYSFLAAAIQIAGAPLPTMIIGALPVVISICANLHQRQMPWKKLLLPLGLLALGIAAVHRDEWQHWPQANSETSMASQLWLAGSLSLGALACWTWYPIRNSRWLLLRPHINSTTWANAQGLTTLPLAAFALLIMALIQEGILQWPGSTWRPFSGTVTGLNWLGPTPVLFAVLMLAIGLGASWLGTLLWNRASQLLPASLMGQLIVFETLAAMFYAYVQRGTWPAWLTWLGIALLIAGVVLGVRAFRSEDEPIER